MKGAELPANCAIDNTKKPIRDPRWLMQEPLGALLAFGVHKGSGLSLVCSLLGAALTGGDTENTPPPASSTICFPSSSIRPCWARVNTLRRPSTTCWPGRGHPGPTMNCCCPVMPSSNTANCVSNTVLKSMTSVGSNSGHWKAKASSQNFPKVRSELCIYPVFPRLHFGHFPTQLEPLDNLSRYLGGPRIWIKHDDCTGLATGGNKTRKLVLACTEVPPALERISSVHLSHSIDPTAALAKACVHL